LESLEFSMSARLLDGKALAATVRAAVAERNTKVVEKLGRPAGLTVVRVGADPASEVYVRNKKKAALEAGLKGDELHLPADVSQDELLRIIDRLNHDDTVDGVLVQLPLPGQLDAERVMAELRADKDADGFHTVNAGLLATGKPGIRPCTPVGCLRLLDSGGIPLSGANAVVIGRSNIVGKPVALLLLERGATVTICHSKTKELPALVRTADIVIAAVGKAELVRGDWLKPGAAVVDVGINRNADGKLVGDVHFASAVEVAGAITPVPGGVGPMTIACLLENAVAMAEKTAGIHR